MWQRPSSMHCAPADRKWLPSRRIYNRADLKMRLYLGSCDYDLEGLSTGDIDLSVRPDMSPTSITLSRQIADESCDEVAGGYVLERAEWPDGFLALSELARALKRRGLIKIA